jgi:hypothetical protein
MSFSSTSGPSSSLGSLARTIPGLGIPYGPTIGQGGGLPGHVPPSLAADPHGNSFVRTRRILKESWNTSSASGSATPHRMVTPFRAVLNAGDVLCREAYSCGGTCPNQQQRSGLHGLQGRMGGVSASCRPATLGNALQLNPSVPASNCNGRYVYDSSDYIGFKRQQALNRNYQDRSYGGDDSFAGQTVLRHVRRF